eukprot:m51a1_g11328 hypothetical protein (452) ;mRNA; f:129718-131221
MATLEDIEARASSKLVEIEEALTVSKRALASSIEKHSNARSALAEKFATIIRIIEQRKLDALNELDSAFCAEEHRLKSGIELLKQQRRGTQMQMSIARNALSEPGSSIASAREMATITGTSPDLYSPLQRESYAAWRRQETTQVCAQLCVPVRRVPGIRIDDADGASALQAIAHMLSSVGRVRVGPDDDYAAAFVGESPKLGPLDAASVALLPPAVDGSLCPSRRAERKFAVVSAGTDARAVDVVGKIRSRIGRCVVDGYVERAGLPGQRESEQYDAVLVWVGGCTGFHDSDAFSDWLSSYMATGGGVVLCPWALDDEFDGLRVDVAESGWLGATLGECVSGRRLVWRRAADPVGASHPLMRGVGVIDGGAFSGHHELRAKEDAEVAASWPDGTPLAVLRWQAAPKSGGSRCVSCVLNLYPVSSDCCSRCWDSGTDYAVLMANALHCVSRS